MAESLTVANNALAHLGCTLIASLAATSREGILVNGRIAPIRKSLLRMHPWNFAMKRKHSEVTYMDIDSVTEDPITTGQWMVHSTAHGLVTGDRVFIKESEGATSINGQFYVTRIDADNVSLIDSVYDATEEAAYISNSAQMVKIPQYEWDYQHALPSDFIRFVSIDGDFEYEIEGAYIFTDQETIDYRYVYNLDTDTSMDPVFLEAFALALAWNLSNILTESTARREQLEGEFRRMLAKARHTDAVENPAAIYGSTDFTDAHFQAFSPFVRDPMT
jgi:hypothetical protein